MGHTALLNVFTNTSRPLMRSVPFQPWPNPPAMMYVLGPGPATHTANPGTEKESCWGPNSLLGSNHLVVTWKMNENAGWAKRRVGMAGVGWRPGWRKLTLQALNDEADASALPTIGGPPSGGAACTHHTHTQQTQT